MTKKKKETKEEEIEREEGELVDALAQLGEDVEKEVEKQEGKLGKKKNKPFAVVLDSPQVLKDIASVYLEEHDLKKSAELGLEKTQKTVIVFYQKATSIGDRFRGLLFLLLGVSLILTGALAREGSLITLREFLAVFGQSIFSRILLGAIGVSIMAYGSNKLFAGLGNILFKPKKPKPKYIQKRLAPLPSKKKKRKKKK
jgi:hypothetical protein